MKIVCSISTACRIVFWVIVAGFALGVLVTGGGARHPDVPPAPSAVVAHCEPGAGTADLCRRT